MTRALTIAAALILALAMGHTINKAMANVVASNLEMEMQ